MKKILAFILCITLVGGIVGCSDSNQEGSSDSNESAVEINIGKVPYPHEWVSVNIIKDIAEERGYKVNIVEGDIGFMFMGLSQGDVDIYPDVWLPVLHKTYVDKYEDDIEIAGTLIEDIPMGIAVPSYSPINSIDELKEKADLVDNKIVGIEPSAGIMLTTEKTIEEYGLEDSIELMDGSTPAMLAELDRAVKANESIAFLAWRPHTMFTKYDIKLLEDSKGIWQFDDAKIGINPQLKEKAPDMYKFTQEFKLSIDEIEEMIYKMEGEEASVEELSKEWIEQHRDEIDQIIEG